MGLHACEGVARWGCCDASAGKGIFSESLSGRPGISQSKDDGWAAASQPAGGADW